MNVTATNPRRVIALLVAVALLFAPLWPAAASPVGDSAHAMHAMAADAGTGMQHAGHDDMAAASSCDQHAACNQLCGAACVQCATATPVAFVRFILGHAIQSPTVPRLHDRLTVAPRLRPPAA